MKVTQCDWAPSLVVEWLCGQLEERGIPGPTYAHTLLSLLHSHYCLHPTPTQGGGVVSQATASLRSHRSHLGHLNIDELLDDLPHPHADLPDLTAITAIKVFFLM